MLLNVWKSTSVLNANIKENCEINATALHDDYDITYEMISMAMKTRATDKEYIGIVCMISKLALNK